MWTVSSCSVTALLTWIIIHILVQKKEGRTHYRVHKGNWVELRGLKSWIVLWEAITLIVNEVGFVGWGPTYFWLLLLGSWTSPGKSLWLSCTWSQHGPSAESLLTNSPANLTLPGSVHPTTVAVISAAWAPPSPATLPLPFPLQQLSTPCLLFLISPHSHLYILSSLLCL